MAQRRQIDDYSMPWRRQPKEFGGRVPHAWQWPHSAVDLQGTCPDSQLIRAKKKAIVWERPRVREAKIIENLAANNQPSADAGT